MELTLQEVALRLNIPEETVHRWIRQGKIPMQRIRGAYSIRLEMLERWAEEHQLKVHLPQPVLQGEGGNEIDTLLPPMRRGGIFYNISGDNKLLVLRAVVEKIPNIGSDDRDLVYGKIVEREQLASTGIGHGIALPHPRSAPSITLSEPQITTCFLSAPVEFGSIDHHPVKLIMVLLSPSTQQHVGLLSKLSFYLRDSAFRDYLLASPAREAIFDKFAEIES